MRCLKLLFKTGFVETLKPQFTPGQVLASPSTSQTQSPIPRMVALPPPNMEEVENLKAQVQDLGEKLETVKSMFAHILWCCKWYYSLKVILLIIYLIEQILTL